MSPRRQAARAFYGSAGGPPATGREDSGGRRGPRPPEAPSAARPRAHRHRTHACAACGHSGRMDVAANPTYIFDTHGVGCRIAGPEGRDAAAHPLTSA